MLIWNKKGFLVAVFVLGCSLAANLLSDHFTGSGEYWIAHRWPFGVSLLVSGLLSWTVGWWMSEAKSRTLVDKETKEEVVLKPSHTFFFIKMHWWGLILLVTGVVTIAIDLVK